MTILTVYVKDFVVFNVFEIKKFYIIVGVAQQKRLSTKSIKNFQWIAFRTDYGGKKWVKMTHFPVFRFDFERSVDSSLLSLLLKIDLVIVWKTIFQIICYSSLSCNNILSFIDKYLVEGFE